MVEFGNENNAATNPTELETADRNFYRNGVVSRPRQYQSPPSVRYSRGKSEGGTYAYPLNIDTGQDYLQINRFEYVRRGANISGPDNRPSGQSARDTPKEPKGTVILPMPKVSDSNGAEWGESDLNIFGIGAVSH